MRMKKYTDWSIKMFVLYGNAIPVWWKKEGCKLFLKWAKKEGLEFVESEEKGNG